MNAEVLDLEARFTVQPTQDGLAPRSITITLRPCWKKPPIKLELVYAYEAGNVVYYHVQEQHG